MLITLKSEQFIKIFHTKKWAKNNINTNIIQSKDDSIGNKTEWDFFTQQNEIWRERRSSKKMWNKFA